jgi:uncharacterized protein
LRFWDASAVVPLLVNEPASSQMSGLVSTDPELAVWWGTRSECVSALARRTRQGVLTSHGEAQAWVVLYRLSSNWYEIAPNDWVRALAEHFLIQHPLRTADAYQLAAAYAWSGGHPQGGQFVCLDGRLRNAAQAEGFTVLP